MRWLYTYIGYQRLCGLRLCIIIKIIVQNFIFSSLIILFSLFIWYIINFLLLPLLYDT